VNSAREAWRRPKKEGEFGKNQKNHSIRGIPEKNLREERAHLQKKNNPEKL